MKNDPIQSLFYSILRDHLPIGYIESILSDIEKEDGKIVYTNKYLAKYAKKISKRLRSKK